MQSHIIDAALTGSLIHLCVHVCAYMLETMHSNITDAALIRQLMRIYIYIRVRNNARSYHLHKVDKVTDRVICVCMRVAC